MMTGSNRIVLLYEWSVVFSSPFAVPTRDPFYNEWNRRSTPFRFGSRNYNNFANATAAASTFTVAFLCLLLFRCRLHLVIWMKNWALPQAWHRLPTPAKLHRFPKLPSRYQFVYYFFSFAFVQLLFGTCACESTNWRMPHSQLTQWLAIRTMVWRQQHALGWNSRRKATSFSRDLSRKFQ